MDKLYSSIKTDLVDPELEAKVAPEGTAEPQFMDTPKDLYAAITIAQPENAEVEVTQQEVEQYAQSSPNKVYAEIIPEKPNILAEERIFVYVPKVGFNSPGIAKFAAEHFNIVGGEVSLKNSYLTNLIISSLLKLNLILVVTELPSVGLANRIYLVPVDGATCNGYVWSEAWISLGNIALNLSDYYTKAQIDSLLSNINLADYYTKTQVDSLFDLFQIDLSAYYTKTQVNLLLDALEAELTNYYTIAQIDSLLDAVTVDLSGYYTKAEIDNMFATVTVDLSAYYTKAQVEALIAGVVSDNLQVYSNYAEANASNVQEGDYAFIVTETFEW